METNVVAVGTVEATAVVEVTAVENSIEKEMLLLEES